jgi:membrane protein implicated in regulation of membrane protease activity
MDPNPYESPPPLPRDANAPGNAAGRAPTGPSSRWWGLLALAIVVALFLSWVPGLGLLIVLVAAPLLFYLARQDCQHPPSSYNREPLQLAGQVAAFIGVLLASGAAFAGVCTPISFSLMYLSDVPLPDDLVVYAVFGLSLAASLAVVYAGYRTIRAASSPTTRGATLPEKFTLPRDARAPPPPPSDQSSDESQS